MHVATGGMTQNNPHGVGSDPQEVENRKTNNPCSTHWKSERSSEQRNIVDHDCPFRNSLVKDNPMKTALKGIKEVVITTTGWSKVQYKLTKLLDDQKQLYSTLQLNRYSKEPPALPKEVCP